MHYWDERNIVGGKHVLACFYARKKFEWVIKETIIDFGFRITWRIMEISEAVILTPDDMSML